MCLLSKENGFFSTSDLTTPNSFSPCLNKYIISWIASPQGCRFGTTPPLPASGLPDGFKAFSLLVSLFDLLFKVWTNVTELSLRWI